MQVNSDLVTPPDRSFTATARRAQIVAATIETIADLGYAQATFGRIAERAGLSTTRLISYHFDSKRELMEQVVANLYQDIGGFMEARLRGQTTAAGALRGYIEANIEYFATHRTQMKALLGVFLSGALTEHGDVDVENLVTVQPVAEILLAGQAAGEFRDFDATLVAACIQRSLEGVPMLLESRPDLDLTACAEELVTMFDLATRAPGPASAAADR